MLSTAVPTEFSGEDEEDTLLEGLTTAVTEADQENFMKEVEKGLAEGQTMLGADGTGGIKTKLSAKSLGQWVAASKGDNVSAHSAPARVWDREVKPGSDLRKEYDALNSMAEKRKFKEKFYADKWENMDESQQYSQRIRNEQEVSSEEYTFGALVVALGGWQWPPAIRGAKTHCLKASRLGPKWCCLSLPNLLLIFFIQFLTFSPFHELYRLF